MVIRHTRIHLYYDQLSAILVVIQHVLWSYIYLDAMQTHHNFYAFRITLSISLRLDSPFASICMSYSITYSGYLSRRIYNGGSAIIKPSKSNGLSSLIYIFRRNADASQFLCISDHTFNFT
jgi:hypothetical protein